MALPWYRRVFVVCHLCVVDGELHVAHWIDDYDNDERWEMNCRVIGVFDVVGWKRLTAHCLVSTLVCIPRCSAALEC